MKEFYDKGTPVHDVRAEHWRADAAEMKQLMYFLLSLKQKISTDSDSLPCSRQSEDDQC